MKCDQCQGTMKAKRENHRYEPVPGLPVTLVDIEVTRCNHCGDYEVAIPRIEALHQAVALYIVSKESRLTGPEVRLLKDYLGWTGTETADRMGVSRETVSRWEQDATPIGPVADRLLRAMALMEMNAEEPLVVLEHAARKSSARLKLRMKANKRGWLSEAA